jgi:hypothetical protein
VLQPCLPSPTVREARLVVAILLQHRVANGYYLTTVMQQLQEERRRTPL